MNIVNTNVLALPWVEVMLFAAGLAFGFVITELHGYLQRKRDVAKEHAKDQKSYRGWLRALRAELHHVRGVIVEITGYVDGGDIPTKRLNYDFIEEARLAIFKHEEDEDFHEILTTAYRDIVHTNGMLDRLEHNPNLRPNVRSSMDGVLDSVDRLLTKIEAKLTLIQKP
jgi:hypothetical protein